MDAVYFTGGDVAALTHARRATRVVATPRAADPLLEGGVAAGRARAQRQRPGRAARRREAWTRRRTSSSRPAARRAGSGRAPRGSGRYEAAQLPGPPQDSYGAGDSFAAGLTFGLGDGRSIEDALKIAARCGAWKLTGRAAYDHQLTRDEL